MGPPVCLCGSSVRLLLISFLSLISVVYCAHLQNSIELWHGDPHTSPGPGPNPGLVEGSPNICDGVYYDPAEHVNGSLSCETGLNGSGSLDTYCIVKEKIELLDDTVVSGAGTLEILSNASLACYTPGCNITIFLSGNLIVNGSINSGTLVIQAHNITVCKESSLSTRGLGGKPPSQTSGTPQPFEGGGGGHGGRGALCARTEGQDQADVFGGDGYDWSTLSCPWGYGSQGASTSKTGNYGGPGGGRVNITAFGVLQVDGLVDADGGSGGEYGGGGSGGSVMIAARELKGNGAISAAGGSGWSGGGGGRISTNVYKSSGVKIMAQGGLSYACTNNSGAAGTQFDNFRQSLTVSNEGKYTQSETLLMEFPHFPLWDTLLVDGRAKASIPLLWSKVQVRGSIKVMSESVLAFGLAHYQTSEFEVVSDQFQATNSTVKVYGALKLQSKMLFLENSTLDIEGGEDAFTSTSDLEASSVASLKDGSVIVSNSNLGMHGQGLLKLNGSGDVIKAERLFISLFFTIRVGRGAVLQAPLDYNSPISDKTSRLQCMRTTCPDEVTSPSEDCTLNTSSPFTLQVCRVEELQIEGTVKGSVVHAQRIRTVSLTPEGVLTASGWGCKGGLGKGGMSETYAAGGGGHGGLGGRGYFNGSWASGGIEYGNNDMPCELGSGSGNSSTGEVTSGGGIIVLGSLEHPLVNLDVSGSLTADGGSASVLSTETQVGGAGGGSGGSLLLFLETLTLRNGSILSTAGGHGGPIGGGGGAGGRVHLHWSNIATGEDYLAIANVKGEINARGGTGSDLATEGSNGTVSARDCPKGLRGIFCEECPVGTYKNVTGSDSSLCKPCTLSDRPRRAVFIYVRGGATAPECPFHCVSERYQMPHCYTPIEELIYILGGPWLFTIFLSSALVLLALVLSVARMKLVGNDEFSGPAPTPHGAHIDHSFPFLESLNEVLETTRVDESQSHIHRMFFMGCNSFGEPWHLPHSPPEQIVELVYEDAYNRFVEELNSLAAYQWWEGSVHSILSVVAYPLGWHWMQWRQRIKVQQLREYVRSEYDHACLRSCRSRALYEGLKVAATPDLMLAYIDVFLGGDEKRADLPPPLLQRLPMSVTFGGNGTYMAAYCLHSDNLLTSLICQVVPATVWYRFVGGLNAQLRTVRKGSLRQTLLPVTNWLNTHVNPRFGMQGIRVDLAWFHATSSGYYQLGIVLNEAGEVPQVVQRSDFIDSPNALSSYSPSQRVGDFPPAPWQLSQSYAQLSASRRRIGGAVLDTVTLPSLEDKSNMFFSFSILIRNLRPIGHQAAVGMVISLLLLADLSLTCLTLLQFFSISLEAFLLVLLVLPLASVLASAAGLNALFSHGPRRAAGLARVYALWNVTSFSNVFVALLYGFTYFILPELLPAHGVTAVTFNLEDDSWWMFPLFLIIVKCIQAWMVDLHIANLEIQDRTLFSEDPTKFWQSS
ncbi:unnamed protein product [Calypogeia fissa]